MTFWLLIRQRRYRSAHETEKEIIKQQADNACSKVPWSKGQDTGLSSRRYWVQVPWGSLWLLSLKVRTPASQAGDDGFESRRSYCGHRIVAVRQIVALLTGRKMSGGHLLCADRSGAKTDSPWSPHGWICPVARAAECKSVTKKHRRFEVYVPLRSAQDKRPLDVLRPAPSTFRLRVRVVYGVPLRSSQSGCSPDILWPDKVVCGNTLKVQILPQMLWN